MVTANAAAVRRNLILPRVENPVDSLEDVAGRNRLAAWMVGSNRIYRKVVQDAFLWMSFSWSTQPVVCDIFRKLQGGAD